MKENPIRNAYTIFILHVGVSMLWLMVSLFSLLLLTGAATTAAHALCFKIQADEEPVDLFKDFFRAMKKDLIPASIVYLLSMLFSGMLFMTYNYASNTGETFIVFTVIISAAYLVAFNLHVYPLMAVFKHERFTGLIKNVVLFMHIHLFTTFKLAGTLALFALIIFFIHPALFIPGLSVYLLINTLHLRSIYQPYIDKLKEEDPNA